MLELGATGHGPRGVVRRYHDNCAGSRRDLESDLVHVHGPTRSVTAKVVSAHLQSRQPGQVFKQRVGRTWTEHIVASFAQKTEGIPVGNACARGQDNAGRTGCAVILRHGLASPELTACVGCIEAGLLERRRYGVCQNA